MYKFYIINIILYIIIFVNSLKRFLGKDILFQKSIYFSYKIYIDNNINYIIFSLTDMS